MEPVYFSAEIKRLQTRADNTVDIVLTIPESEGVSAALLLAIWQSKPLVTVEIRPMDGQ